MNDIRLDHQTHDELISEVKDFILKETNVEISEVKASRLLDTILNNVKDTMYDQALFQTRSEVMQQMANILGIDKGPAH